MPSPLSGLTQPAASPISAQLAPATLLTRAAHRQQRRGRHPQVAGELELVATLVGVGLHQRLDGDVGRPLRGGQRADADVHLAGAEREDPAVAAEELAVLAAQLEVGADPRVVGHLGVDVGPAGDAVHRVAVPLAAQQLAQRRAHAVGHDEPRQSISKVLLAPAEHRPRRPASPSMRTSTARAPSRASAPLLMATVRRWSSSSVRATADPHAGRPLPGSDGQGSSSVWPKPCARSPWLTVWARSQSSRPSFCSSPIARGVSPSPHVLSRGKTAASTRTVSSPARALHAAAADPAGRRRRRGRRSRWLWGWSPGDSLLIHDG